MTTINYSELFVRLDSALIKHQSFQRALTCIEQVAATAKRYADPEVALLLGESRSGKTRILEIVEQQWPACRKEEQRFVPIVRVRISKKPTTKGLITQLLHKLGDPLYDRRGTETMRLVTLIEFLKRLEVRVIMLDEFQHFVSERGYINFEVADLIKLLADEGKVSLVLAGLPDAMCVINSNEQLAGRALRPVYLKRFDWEVKESRQEFINVVSDFSRALLPLSLPDFNNEDWGFRWYCATGGLIGYAAKIFRKALDHAANDKRNAITLDDLGRAYDEAVHVKNTGNVLPFSRSFLAHVTPDAMALAKAIGTREGADDKPRPQRRSPQVKTSSSNSVEI